MSHHDDDFDWHENDSVIIPRQCAVAVYFNPDGLIIIRQQCWPDDDSWIAVTTENAPRLAHALLEMVGETPLNGPENSVNRSAAPLPLPAPETKPKPARKAREAGNGAETGAVIASPFKTSVEVASG